MRRTIRVVADNACLLTVFVAALICYLVVGALWR